MSRHVRGNASFSVALLRRMRHPRRRHRAMVNGTVQGEFPERGGHARLALTADPSVRTVLPGAGWPRTRHSASELAGLVMALDARDTVMGLIMLSPYGWLGRPRRVQVADRTVRIAWIADLDPMVVIGTAECLGRGCSRGPPGSPRGLPGSQRGRPASGRRLPAHPHDDTAAVVRRGAVEPRTAG